MKKMITLLFTAAMIFILTACGGNVGEDVTMNETNVSEETAEDDKIDASEVVEQALEDAEELDSFSVEAVEYYLKKTTGLELSALEPDWEWKLKNDYCAYGDSPDSGYGHAVIKFTKTEGEVTEEEYQTWYQKVFDATAAVSDDGYNIIGYEFVGEGEDALAEVAFEDAIDGWMPGWVFKVNGKLMTVYVSSEYDNDKESEIGNLLYYDSAQVDVAVGLQKSWDDTMDEVEQYVEEHEDEIKDALEDYMN